MNHDVQQWLTEIRSLQHRLTQVSQERAEAYEQVSRWYKSYQTEATQRRTDTQRLQQAIYHLVAENKRLKQQITHPRMNSLSCDSSTEEDLSGLGQGMTSSEVAEMVGSPFSSSVMENTLKQQLRNAVAECDRLTQALVSEQQAHESTRETLMNALGDVVEQLERERERHTRRHRRSTSSSLAPTSTPSQLSSPGQPPDPLI